MGYFGRVTRQGQYARQGRRYQARIEGLEARAVLNSTFGNYNFGGTQGNYYGSTSGGYVGNTYGNYGSYGNTQVSYNNPYPTFPDGSNPYPTFLGGNFSGTNGVYTPPNSFFSDLGSSLYDSIANLGANFQAGLSVGPFQTYANSSGQVYAGTQYLTVNEGDQPSIGASGFVNVYGPVGVVGGNSYNPVNGQATTTYGIGLGVPGAYGYLGINVYNNVPNSQPNTGGNYTGGNYTGGNYTGGNYSPAGNSGGYNSGTYQNYYVPGTGSFLDPSTGTVLGPDSGNYFNGSSTNFGPTSYNYSTGGTYGNYGYDSTGGNYTFTNGTHGNYYA